jgi:hypothetical protein
MGIYKSKAELSAVNSHDNNVSPASHGNECCAQESHVNLHTEEVLEQIDASSVILAGLVLTCAHIELASITGPSLSAHALKAPDLIPASRPVKARVG